MNGIKIEEIKNKRAIKAYTGVEGYKEIFTFRNIATSLIEIFGGYKMPYTKNWVKSVEEMDMEIEHYNFLRKYNLVWKI